jgi:O-antigen/teichoic acid export membrane protein
MKLPAYTTLSHLVGRWSPRIVCGILDQGLFSGSNFLVNILLARWLLPDAYGSFAIAFSLYLGLAGLVCSLTLEPMMVYGSTDFVDRIDDYLTKVAFMHFVVSGLLAAVMFAVAAFFDGTTSSTIKIAACALPFMLQVWFIRRAFYCTMRIPQAAATSLLYSVLLIGGIMILKTVDLVMPVQIYEVFILASLASFLCYLIIIRKAGNGAGVASAEFKHIIRSHWRFGKWLIVASVAASVSTLLYAPILGLVSELKDAAAYKAVQNLSLPFSQMLVVFALLALPGMSREVKRGSWSQIRKYIWGLTATFLLVAVLYGAILITFGRQILMLLYASKFYVEYYWLIPVFAVVIVIRSINQSLATIIRAYESTKTILVAKISSAVVVLSVLAATVPTMGLRGILLGMCAGVLTELCIVVGFFFRVSGRERRNKC